MKWGDDPDGFLFPMGTVRDAATAKPALLGIFHDGRFSLFRVTFKDIAHTDIITPVATIADILIEVNVFEWHFFLPMLYALKI